MKNKEAQIFKIQRPIVYTGEYQVLCYNEDRSIMGQFSPSTELLDMFDEDEYKIFVNGSFDEETGKIIVVDKIPTDIITGAGMEF